MYWTWSEVTDSQTVTWPITGSLGLVLTRTWSRLLPSSAEYSLASAAIRFKKDTLLAEIRASRMKDLLILAKWIIRVLGTYISRYGEAHVKGTMSNVQPFFSLIYLVVLFSQVGLFYSIFIIFSFRRSTFECVMFEI